MIAAFLPSRLPIIQAPMAGSQSIELCAAVSEAGSLGSLPAAMLRPSELRDQIAEIRRWTAAPLLGRREVGDANLHGKSAAALSP
jgi:nitronate monooxygenase